MIAFCVKNFNSTKVLKKMLLKYSCTFPVPWYTWDSKEVQDKEKENYHENFSRTQNSGYLRKLGIWLLDSIPLCDSGVTMKGVVNESHKAIVEAGGGEYVPGMMGDLVLFNSPATGSTLAVKEKDLTPDAVRARIAASDETFRRSTTLCNP